MARNANHLGRFDSFIVPHDMTHVADRVLPIVGRLARRSGLSVRLVTTASPGLVDYDRAELARHARRIHGCPVTPVALESADPVEDLADFADRHPGALVCLSTHGRSAFGAFFFGSMTDDLLRRLNRPILAVGPHVDLTRELSENLLVGVDQTALDTTLLEAASAWQATFGGSIEFVEAVTGVSSASGSTPTGELTAARSIIPSATTTMIDSRDPVSALVDVAGAANSVIALASHLRRGVERVLIGSVTWEVVRWSPTPVLIVPSA